MYVEKQLSIIRGVEHVLPVTVARKVDGHPNVHNDF